MKLKTVKHLLVLTSCATIAGALCGCRSKTSTEKYNGLLDPRGVLPPAQYAAVAKSNTMVQPVAAASATEKASEGAFQFENDDTLSIPPADTANITAPTQTASQDAASKHRVMPVAPANGKLPPATSSKNTQGNATGKIYIVKSGDVLSKIAKNHGVKVSEIRALNSRLSTSDVVYVGQKLKMPANATGSDLVDSATAKSAATQAVAAAGAGKTGSAAGAAAAKKANMSIPADGIYTVVNGDSLWIVAHRFGLKSADIRAWNNLTSDNLRVGQKLKLRGDAVVPQSAAKKGKSAATAKTTKTATAKTDAAAAPVAASAADSMAAPAEKADAGAVPEAASQPQTDNAAAPVAAPAADQGNAAGTPEMNKAVHTVVAGNTLEELAKIYFTSVEEILKSNPNIKSNEDLKPGTQVIIYW